MLYFPLLKEVSGLAWPDGPHLFYTECRQHFEAPDGPNTVKNLGELRLS